MPPKPPAHETPAAETPLSKEDTTKAFEAALAHMVAAGHTHKDIIDVTRAYMLTASRALPPVKVLHSASHSGGYCANGEAQDFFHESARYKAFARQSLDEFDRSDPLLLEALAAYGRSEARRLPFLFEDLKACRRWGLSGLLEKLSPAVAAAPADLLHEYGEDLVARAVAHLASIPDDPHRPKRGTPGTSGRDIVRGASGTSFIDFARKFPAYWGLHVNAAGGAYHRSEGLVFAHKLLKEARDRYFVISNPTEDREVCELIGIASAQPREGQFKVQVVPALVHYTISDYDGLESVEF